MRVGYETKFYPDCKATSLLEAEAMAKCPNATVEPFLTVAKALIPEEIFLLKDYAVSFAEKFQNVSDSNLDFETLSRAHGYVDSILYAIEVNYKHSVYSFATPRRQADYCFYVNRFHVSLSMDIDAGFWLKPLPVWLWVLFFVLSAILFLLSCPKHKLWNRLLLFLSFVQAAIMLTENAGLKANALQKVTVRFPYRTFEHVINGLQTKKIRLLITQPSWDQLEIFLNGTSLLQTLQILKSFNFSQITLIQKYDVGCRLLAANVEAENITVVLFESHHLVAKCDLPLVNQLFEHRLQNSGIPPVYNAYSFSKNSRRYREIYSRMAEFFSIQEHKRFSFASELLKQPLRNTKEVGLNDFPIEALIELYKAFAVGIALSIAAFVVEMILNRKC